MKKLILALIVLLAASNLYVSCTPESLTENEEEISGLQKDELKDSDI